MQIQDRFAVSQICQCFVSCFTILIKFLMDTAGKCKGARNRNMKTLLRHQDFISDKIDTVYSLLKISY